MPLATLVSADEHDRDFHPQDDRGVALLDEVEREAPAPFRQNLV